MLHHRDMEVSYISLLYQAMPEVSYMEIICTLHVECLECVSLCIIARFIFSGTNESHLLRNIDNLMYADLQHITQYTQVHTLFYIPVFSPTAYSRQSANNAEKSSSTASKQSNIDFMNGLKAWEYIVRGRYACHSSHYDVPAWTSALLTPVRCKKWSTL